MSLSRRADGAEDISVANAQQQQRCSRWADRLDSPTSAAKFSWNALFAHRFFLPFVMFFVVLGVLWTAAPAFATHDASYDAYDARRPSALRCAAFAALAAGGVAALGAAKA